LIRILRQLHDTPLHYSNTLFFLMIPPPPISPLFPYTTLFRSQSVHDLLRQWGENGQLRRRRLRFAGAGQMRSEIAFGAFVLRQQDRKSTRLNSSHRTISYAVFCLKKKKKKKPPQ